MKKNTWTMIGAFLLCILFLSGCRDQSGDIIAEERNIESHKEAAADFDPDSDTVRALVDATTEPVHLTMWTSEDDQDMTRSIAESFTALFPKVDLKITVGIEEEPLIQSAVLADVEHAADVYTFVDDQIEALVEGGALSPIKSYFNYDPRDVNVPSSVEAASVDDTLYAYPMTADNGYFLYYDKSFFSKEDIESLDTMVDIAAKEHKKVAMHLSNGWYLYSFFRGGGCILKRDGENNSCDWDSEKGEAVANAIAGLCRTGAFVNMDDATMTEQLGEGQIVAMINGTWRAADVQQIWGSRLGVAQLPEFTVGERKVQMASFSGCKLVGINPYSDHVEWGKLFAEYLTDEDNQIRRFEDRRLGPSNEGAQASSGVQLDPVIVALTKQSLYAYPQRVGSSYWDAAAWLGEELSKSPQRDEIPALLHTAAETIRTGTPMETETEENKEAGD
ncbi:MAG: extracellular solute-binding protein [Lachnospiraceae bacterium]|nr:extracellular solute-binding protein [Lachnospiraceae bacterium]